MRNCIDHALKGRARQVVQDERSIGVLSTGERIAVALILDRADLLPRDYTMLDAVDQQLAEPRQRSGERLAPHAPDVHGAEHTR